MSELISVLLVEDNAADARYVQELLPASKYAIALARTLANGLELIDSEFDVALLDLSLPDSVGLETFNALNEKAPGIPIIVLTGLNDEDIATESVKLGAQDYLRKSGLDEAQLERSIRYAVERKRLENKTREAESNLRLALMASNTGVWSWDLQTGMLNLDELACRLLGLPPDQTRLSLHSALAMVHPDDLEAVSNQVRRTIESGDECDVEFRVTCPDDSIRFISAQGKSFSGIQSKRTRVKGVCRDVTRSKREEEDRSRLLLLEQREDFMTTLTHDLKNPLIGSNRILELLAEQALGEIAPKHAQLLLQLRDSNKTLLLMIQNLIDVYRFEKDVHAVYLENTDLLALSTACLQDIAVIAEYRNVSVRTEFADHVKAALADPNAIRRVVQNLLDNALKFTPQGGIITIRIAGSNGKVHLEVSDTGPGIPLAEQKQLFQRFAQGSAGKQHTRGTGLGLYLCKQIIDAHHGQIECRSGLGEGATFRVSLPAA